MDHSLADQRHELVPIESSNLPRCQLVRDLSLSIQIDSNDGLNISLAI